MTESKDAPRNNSHPGINPSAAFLLCLFLGPLGLLRFGKAETLIVGSVYLAGIGAAYWIWPSMLPEFIGFSLVLLAFTGKRWAEARQSDLNGMDGSNSDSGTRTIAVALLIDIAMLCAGEAVLKQLWIQFHQMHILGVILSLCVTLPVGFLGFHALRGIILRRIPG